MKELKKSLFEKAMEWYSKGDKFREAALELFPKEQLEREIENYKKSKVKAELESRDNVLQRLLEKCKKAFPIGTVVYSDDGTDNCPNIIIEEPYIGNTKYGNHIPFSVYEYNIPNEQRKTVLAKALRLYRGEPEYEDSRFTYSIVGLEILLNRIEKPDNFYKYPIINLNEYCGEKLKEKAEAIQRIKDKIEDAENDLKKWKEELAGYESYDPTKLTKEKVKQLVIEDKMKRT